MDELIRIQQANSFAGTKGFHPTFHAPPPINPHFGLKWVQANRQGRPAANKNIPSTNDDHQIAVIESWPRGKIKHEDRIVVLLSPIEGICLTHQQRSAIHFAPYFLEINLIT